MLSQRKRTQKIVATLKPLAVTSALLLVGLVFVMYWTPPARGADATQAVGPNHGNHQEMMAGNDAITSTMSMAEMGAMMDVMMAQMTSMMASMPMSGTMPMSGEMPMDGMTSMMQMGQMMQMMGMMYAHMGQMQMMMGTMMPNGMMGEGMMGEGMMGQGMGIENATPEATEVVPPVSATVEPEATTTVSDTTTISDTTTSSEPEAAARDSGLPAAVLATTPQSATAGAITVEATPLTTEGVTEGFLDVAFAIRLETHSVELDFDLAARATLTIGEATFSATSWEPSAPGGHHVAGTLHFTIDEPAQAALAKVGVAALELRDIDGVLVTLHFAIDER